MTYGANEATQARVERILAELYPRAGPVSGLSIGEIAEMVAAKEARRRKKANAPKSGFETVVGLTSYANPRGPCPRRPKGMTKEEWQAHLAAKGIEPEKVRPRVRLCS
jgi:hypothetical protein